MITAQPFPENPAQRCRACFSPLVQLLSDAAGRIFGCLRCGTCGEGHGDTRPAEVTHVERRSSRERRRLARSFTRGRRGARRISPAYEVTRPHSVQWVVLRQHLFPKGTAVRDIGDGWALGMTPSPPIRGVLLVNLHEVSSEGYPELRVEDLRLRQIGGPLWGWYDDKAPFEVVAAGFNRLYAERLSSVREAFFRVVAAWGRPTLPR